jgi:hypothetical protein
MVPSGLMTLWMAISWTAEMQSLKVEDTEPEEEEKEEGGELTTRCILWFKQLLARMPPTAATAITL